MGHQDREDGMQGRVELGGVQQQPPVGGSRLAQDHRLGPVSRAQHPVGQAEARPVLQAQPRQRRIKLRAGQLLAALGRGDVGQRRRRRGADGRHGMQRPAAIAQARARLDAQRAGLGIAADAQVGALALERERAQDLEIAHLQRLGPQHPHPRRQRHLDQAGGREHGRPVHGMVGQPGQAAGAEIAAPDRHPGLRCPADQGVEVVEAPGVQVIGRGRGAEAVIVPRIGGQVGMAARPRPEEGAALDAGAHGMGAGDHLGRVGVGLRALVHGAHHLARRAQPAQGVAHIGGQHRARRDLDEGAAAGRDQRAHRLLEAHHVAGIAPPVVAVERAAIGDLAGGCRGIEELSRCGLQPAQILDHPCAQRLDRRAVIGDLDIQHHPRHPPLAPEPAEQGGELFPVARHGDAARAVDAGDRDARQARLGQRRGHLGRAGRDRRHPARPAQAVERARARMHQMHRIAQRQDARGAGRGDLAHRMAGHRVGAQAAGSQRGHQRHLHREQHRLGDLGRAELAPEFGIGDQRMQIRTAQPCEQGRHLVEAGAEGFVAGQKVPPHAGPLRTVAREQQGGAPALARGPAGHQARGAAALGMGVELGDQRRAVAAQRHQPVGQRLAAPCGRGHQIGQLGRIGRGDPRPPGRRQPPEAFRAGRAERERTGPGRGGSVRRAPLLGAGLAQQRMGIGPAETEGIHPRIPGAGPGRDRHRLARKRQAQPVEVDVRVGRPHMQRGRQLAAFQRQLGLQQPDEARGRLEMAEIRLRRADRQRLRPRRAIDRADRPRLQRVADRRAGAMRLDEGQPVRVEPEAVADQAQEVGLPAGRGQRHAHRAPVGIDAGSGQDPPHGIAIRPRPVQPAQHEHHRPFRADIAVRARVECPAQPGGRQHRRAREADEGPGGDQQVDPADDGGVDLARHQRLGGGMERIERGGAGGVDGEAGAAQVEEIGDAVGDDRQGVAGHELGIDAGEVGEEMGRMVRTRRADEDAGALARDRGLGQPGMLQRLPDHLQQDALLGIHLRRLARRDREEAGIETPDVVDLAGGEGIALAAGGRVGVVQKARLEPVGPDARDHAPPLGQDVPERPGIRRAGQAAGITGDGDVVFCGGLGHPRSTCSASRPAGAAAGAGRPN
ncbi:MAG: hypothetical protein KatS3mg118_0432 [Paracoccaceae bacterium]|nr:MAG: hypothetical protein KatS3mg118_0432 [Paracoccaceae bacterium]